MTDLNHNLPPLPTAIADAITADGKAGKADAKAERDLDAVIAEYNATAHESETITAERLSGKYATEHGGIFAQWRLEMFCNYVGSVTTPTIARAYRDAKGSLPKAKKVLTTAQGKQLSDTRGVWNDKFNKLTGRLKTAERDAQMLEIQAKQDAGEDLTEAEQLRINPPLPSAVDASVKAVAAFQKIVQPEDGAEKYRDDFQDGGMMKIASYLRQIEDELSKYAKESNDS